MHNNEKRKYIGSGLKKIGYLMPIFFWALIIFGFSDLCVGVLTLITALLHESGHVIYLYFTKGELRLPKGKILGLGLKKDLGMSYGEEAAYYIAGPVANLVGAVLGYFLIPHLDDYAVLLILLNLVTALANLLPIEGHDGYGFLRAVLAKRDVGESVLSSVSLLFSALLTLAALYTVDRLGEGYFIFAVLLSSTLSAVGKRLRHIKNEIY